MDLSKAYALAKAIVTEAFENDELRDELRAQVSKLVNLSKELGETGAAIVMILTNFARQLPTERSFPGMTETPADQLTRRLYVQYFQAQANE